MITKLINPKFKILILSILVLFFQTNIHAKDSLDVVWNSFWIATDYVDALSEQDRQSLVTKYPRLTSYRYDIDEYPYTHYEWYENERCIEGLFFLHG